MSAGIESDNQRRRENQALLEDGRDDLRLCERCEGTGNEFYSRYRACADCGGKGLIEVPA